MHIYSLHTPAGGEHQTGFREWATHYSTCTMQPFEQWYFSPERNDLPAYRRPRWHKRGAAALALSVLGDLFKADRSLAITAELPFFSLSNTHYTPRAARAQIVVVLVSRESRISACTNSSSKLLLGGGGVNGVTKYLFCVEV